jgi:hypothetical protein
MPPQKPNPKDVFEFQTNRSFFPLHQGLRCFFMLFLTRKGAQKHPQEPAWCKSHDAEQAQPKTIKIT